MPVKNYYATLEVPVGGSLEEIREAYRRLSQENLDNERVFSELKEAYEVLTTPVRRSEYDMATWGETFQGEDAEGSGKRIATQVNLAALAGMGRCPLGIDAQCPVVQAMGALPDAYCPECGFLLATLPQNGFESLPNFDMARQPRLEEDNGLSHRLRPGLNTVGREGTDVLLVDKTVSRQHARIEVDDAGSVTLEDLSSTNGTQVNGETLTPHEITRLAGGDQLRFGNFPVAFRLPEEEAASAETPAPAATDARLVQVRENGGDVNHVHPLVPGVTTFGRRAESSIIISGDPYVSGSHAQIIADGDVFRLTDIGSTNGTLLNGIPLAPNEPALLSPGDQIVIGGSAFRFEPLSAPAEPEVNA